VFCEVLYEGVECESATFINTHYFSDARRLKNCILWLCVSSVEN